MEAPTPISPQALTSSLLEPLLGVHSAHTTAWLADAAATAAERGLGALYGLLYIGDAAAHLVAERPASSARLRGLVKLHQGLGVDLSTIRFDPRERELLDFAIREGNAVAVEELREALPLRVEAEKLDAAQRRLGIVETWLAPLRWNGENLGLLALLMPADPPAPLLHAELLGQHVAVALANLRGKDAGRKHGELDAVRWVYDEWRFLEELTQETRRAQRHERSLSIIVLRVRNLEELHTRYGRFLAERLLRHIAARLADAMRDTDFLGASGDDGFAAILVEAGHEGAKRAEERLLAGLDSMQLPDADLPSLHLELAYGTATLPEDGETAEDLMAAAEARLAQSTVDLASTA